MRRHALRLIGGPATELRVPADTLIEAVGALLEGAQRAARLFVEGESVRPGARPAWLDAACRIEVTGIASGSAVIAVEAPTLAEAVPDRFGPDRQASLFGEPGTPLDSSRTAVDFFGDVLAAVVSGEREGLRADRSLLDSCIRFARAAGSTYDGLQLEGLAGRSEPVIVRRDIARAIEQLRDETPAPRAVRVSGVLDTISASKSDVLLVLEGGETVVGRLRQPDPDGLRDLFGTTVLVSGVAQYRPSGRLSVVDVEYIGPASTADAMWSRVPEPMPVRGAAVAPLVAQDATSGVSAIFGTWPGDETEEELLAALKELG